MADEQKIKITWDDVENVNNVTLDPIPLEEGRTWGTVSNSPISGISAENSADNIFMKGWFYLGAAGLFGSFLAWLICEPSFGDERYAEGWGNTLIFPLMVILICLFLGTIESFIERSWKRAVLRGIFSFGLGLILGFVFNLIANILFRIFLVLWMPSNATAKEAISNPILWISRGLAWASFGIAGGLIFGIVSKSGKKISYGILGGMIGGLAGGVLFDPISLVTGGGEASRAIGMIILGASTGAAIGLVESALKERWLFVSNGPLAGKQFILYQDIVTIGKDQSSTIFLFKDPSISEHHATISRLSGKSVLTAIGPVEVSGQRLHAQMKHFLRTGDSIQIGRYTFLYAEKEQNINS